MKILKTIGFWFLSLTWGAIMTIIGACGAFWFLIKGKKPKFYKGSVYFVVDGRWGGVNFGPFFFIDERVSLSTIKHEWGHGIQNIVMGPLHVIFSIWSFLRYWYRRIIVSEKCPVKWRKKRSDLPDYDSYWFEGSATKIGNKYYKEGDYNA